MRSGNWYPPIGVSLSAIGLLFGHLFNKVGTHNVGGQLSMDEWSPFVFAVFWAAWILVALIVSLELLSHYVHKRDESRVRFGLTLVMMMLPVWFMDITAFGLPVDFWLGQVMIAVLASAFVFWLGARMSPWLQSKKEHSLPQTTMIITAPIVVFIGMSFLFFWWAGTFPQS